jgi:branched-subunit amino acid aminotransferase/4-amino-4-deoxychorismate lyase
MSGVVWFDDRPLDAAGAYVPIDDASVMLGDGVFESIAIGPRGPFAVTRHIRRLRSAAERIGVRSRRSPTRRASRRCSASRSQRGASSPVRAPA